MERGRRTEARAGRAGLAVQVLSESFERMSHKRRRGLAAVFPDHSAPLHLEMGQARGPIAGRIIVLASGRQWCREYRVSRTPRVQCSGGICQVMSQGDRREDLFLGDEKRHDLLKPTETIQQIVSRVHLGTSWNAKARLHVRLRPREGVAPRTAKGTKNE